MNVIMMVFTGAWVAVVCVPVPRMAIVVEATLQRSFALDAGTLRLGFHFREFRL